LESEELEIRKWTGFARITKMELRDDFGRMPEFISRNP
jgi:hypothetical protein